MDVLMRLRVERFLARPARIMIFVVVTKKLEMVYHQNVYHPLLCLNYHSLLSNLCVYLVF